MHNVVLQDLKKKKNMLEIVNIFDACFIKVSEVKYTTRFRF